MKNLSVLFVLALSLFSGFCRAQDLTIDPTNQTVIAGSTAYFDAFLTTTDFCGGNFSYQWQHRYADHVLDGEIKEDQERKARLKQGLKK